MLRDEIVERWKHEVLAGSGNLSATHGPAASFSGDVFRESPSRFTLLGLLLEAYRAAHPRHCRWLAWSIEMPELIQPAPPEGIRIFLFVLNDRVCRRSDFPPVVAEWAGIDPVFLRQVENLQQSTDDPVIRESAFLNYLRAAQSAYRVK